MGYDYSKPTRFDTIRDESAYGLLVRIYSHIRKIPHPSNAPFYVELGLPNGDKVDLVFGTETGTLQKPRLIAIDEQGELREIQANLADLLGD